MYQHIRTAFHLAREDAMELEAEFYKPVRDPVLILGVHKCAFVHTYLFIHTYM